MTEEFFDVIVVGAGAAGIGMGVAHCDAGLDDGQRHVTLWGSGLF